MGVGAALITLPLWSTSAAQVTAPSAIGHAVLHRADGLAAWALRPYDPKPVGEVVHVDHFGNQPWRDENSGRMRRGD
jgi:hypothetical protein